MTEHSLPATDGFSGNFPDSRGNYDAFGSGFPAGVFAEADSATLPR